MSTPHGPAPPSHPVLLSSCAVEGCLQLIFATTTLDGSDAYHLPAGADLSPFFCQLHAQLPGSCVDGLVTIHLNDTLAVFKGGAGQQLPPELLHLPSSEGDEGLHWAPICFAAGSAEGAEVELTSGVTVLGVEAVVRYRSGGEEESKKLQVEKVAGSHDCVRWVVGASGRWASGAMSTFCALGPL
jgi:hypothetical protein